MTLRPEVVRERLVLARRNLAVLRAAASVPRDNFLRELEKQWALAYGLQVTVQSLLDAGAHILTAAFAESPRDYGDIIVLLARHGVVAPAVAAPLRGLAGFRNVLVHEYAEVSFELVHEKLQRLDEIEDLLAALERWLATREG